MYAFTIDSPDPRIRIELHTDEYAEAPWTTRSSLGSVLSDSLGDHLADGETRAAYFSTEGEWHWSDDESPASRWIRELRFDGFSVLPFRHDDYGSSGDQIAESDPENANGILYVSAAKVAAEFGPTDGHQEPYAADRTVPPITASMRRQARACMRGELAEMKAWAEGNVYGFVIRLADPADEDGNVMAIDGEGTGEVLESVWGFYEAEVDYNHPERMYVAQEALGAALWCARSLDAEDANRDDAAARDIVTV